MKRPSSAAPVTYIVPVLTPAHKKGYAGLASYRSGHFHKASKIAVHHGLPDDEEKALCKKAYADAIAMWEKTK